MAEITTKQRKALPDSKFASPEDRKYPVDTKARADNAAARLEQQKGSMSPATYARIKSKITAAQKRFGETPKPKTARAGRIHVRADLSTGGALHVSHHAMSDRVVHLDGVSVTLADDNAKPVWIQLAKPGTFRGHPAGPFTMNAQTFEEIVRNFKATENQRVPIDYEHASEADPTEGSIPTNGAPAQGWIVDMRVDGGNLWGLVEWGPQAREQIRSGQYRYFSPAIRFGAKDRVTGQQIGARMTSGALTNNPFLDGLKPLAAKDALVAMRGALAHSPHEYMPAIKAALRMPELCSARECGDTLGMLRGHLDAVDGDHEQMHEGIKLGDYLKPLRDLTGAVPGTTWDEVFDIVEDLIDAAIDKHVIEDHGGDAAEGAEMTEGEGNGADEETTMADMNDKNATTTIALSEAQTKVAELSLQLKDESARADKAEGELKTLREWKVTREEKDLADRVSEAFDTYKDERKLTDGDREAMLIVLKANAKLFEERYPRVSADKRHLLRDLTPQRTPQSGGSSTVVETHAELTKRLMSERKLSYPDAQCEADRMLRQTA